MLNQPSFHNQQTFLKTNTADCTTRTDRLDNQETKVITKLLASAACASLAIGQVRVFWVGLGRVQFRSDHARLGDSGVAYVRFRLAAARAGLLAGEGFRLVVFRYVGLG